MRGFFHCVRHLGMSFLAVEGEKKVGSLRTRILSEGHWWDAPFNSKRSNIFKDKWGHFGSLLLQVDFDYK